MTLPTKQEIFSLLKSNYYILIALGVGVRVLMLLFVYLEIPFSFLGRGAMGDVLLNYYDIDSVFTGEWKWNQNDLAYPPISVFLLVFLRIAAFNNLYIFFFYAFILELLTISLFYPVLKRFQVDYSKVIFGLLFVNPLYFFSYVSRFFISGLRITDSFFLIWLLLSLYFYPKDDKKYFYFFLGMSMCAKWYTLPVFPLFIIKYAVEKRWEELKKMLLYMTLPIFIFLITPVFYLPNYLNLYINWALEGNPLTQIIPIYIKIIPFLVLLSIVLYNIKNVDRMTLTFLSLVLTTSYILFSRFYIRYFAPLLLYGHLFYYKSSQQIQEDGKTKAIDTHCNIFLASIALGTISLLISYLELLFYTTIY